MHSEISTPHTSQIERRRTAGRAIRSLVGLAVLSVAALVVPCAGAIVRGTTAVAPSTAASVAYIEIRTPADAFFCSGTLISPTVVMTAAHCVYEKTKYGNLIGIAKPSQITVRVGSTNTVDESLGVRANVVAVLPQPHYSWNGRKSDHDVALLALDRTMPQMPATLATSAPADDEPLLIAGYGQTATSRRMDGLLRDALLVSGDQSSCPDSNASWLFCGVASTEPAQPGGTGCFGDSGGPAFSTADTTRNVVVGVMSYISNTRCELARSTYLVLVASERGFIDRALATPPDQWGFLRDDPPHAQIKSLHRRVGARGTLSVRVDDDYSRHSRVEFTFLSRRGKVLGRVYRAVTTNRWVSFPVSSSATRHIGWICADGTDEMDKPSNTACGADIVR